MLDFIVFVLLTIFLISGFFRGFKNELTSIINITLFLIISYYYGNYFGHYLFNLINIDEAYFPSYLYLIIGCIFIYISTSIIFYLFKKIIFKSFFISENLFFDKFLGMILGFVKGIILVSAFFSLMVYYDYFNNIINFDNNSLFLDYFLQYSVQLQDVWNHWYS